MKDEWKGGQGRDAEDIRGSAVTFSVALIGAAVVLALALVLSGCCAACNPGAARIEARK